MFKGIQGKAMMQNRALTQGELLEVVPSIFAETAHESRSERFQPVTTIQVVDRLGEEGYLPYYAIQTKCRDDSKTGFTKHMLRFRKNEGIAQGEADEIILVNANDGTSSYQLMAGQFRFVCCNGLIMGDFNSHKVYHRGNNIMDDVIEGVYSVVDEFDLINQHKAEMKQMMLTDKQRQTFALSAFILKEGIEALSAPKFDFKQLLNETTVNTHDRGNKSLYSTFNVLQQNLMQGGQTGFNDNGRRTRSRGITNIAKNISINSGLWNIAKDILDDSANVEKVINQ